MINQNVPEIEKYKAIASLANKTDQSKASRRKILQVNIKRRFLQASARYLGLLPEESGLNVMQKEISVTR